MSEDLWITISEATELLRGCGMGRQTIYARALEGYFGVTRRKGKVLLIHSGAVEEYRDRVGNSQQMIKVSTAATMAGLALSQVYQYVASGDLGDVVVGDNGKMLFTDAQVETLKALAKVKREAKKQYQEHRRQEQELYLERINFKEGLRQAREEQAAFNLGKKRGLSEEEKNVNLFLEQVKDTKKKELPHDIRLCLDYFLMQNPQHECDRAVLAERLLEGEITVEDLGRVVGPK
jgi:hypothetical protein